MLPHLILAFALASRFVAALQGHDVTAMRSMGVTERSAFSGPLRDTLDRYSRIAIDSWTVEAVEGDPAVARIRVRGSGVAVNAQHDWKPIPASWIVKIAWTPHGPRIESVTTEDHYIAQHVIAARDDCAREEIIAAHPEFSVHDLLHAVLDELKPIEHLELNDSLHFVISTSEAREDWDVESRALMEAWTLDVARMGVTIAERTNDCDVIAQALFKAGNIIDNLGLPDEAFDLRSRAVALADALNDGRTALKALHNMVSKKIVQGDLRRALLLAELLGVKARQFGWREGEIVSSLDIGDIDETIGDDEAAAALHRRGIAELDAIGNADRAIWTSVDLAEIETRLGHYDRAVRLLRGTLQRAPRDFHDRAGILDDLVELYLERGRTNDAMELLRTYQPHPLTYADVAIARHRYTDALGYARQVAGCTAENDEACWRGPLVEARALEHLGRRDEAIAKLDQSINEIEQRRALIGANELGRARFFELKLEPYRQLLDLYLRAGRARDALRVAETVKARALLDTLSLGRPDLRAALTAAEEERRRQIEERIEHLNRALLAERPAPERAALERARSEVRKELEEFDTEMTLRHPFGHGVESSALAENLDSIVGSPDVAAIEYTVLPRSVVAFVVARDAHGSVAVHAARIDASAQTLADRVAALRRAIAARSPSSQSRLAQMYQLLVAPVRQWTAGKTLLFIVPDGALWQVPFQALTTPAGQPMIAEAAVAYAPSFAALTAIHPPPHAAQRRTLLAMGDATVGSEAAAHLRSFERDASLGSLPDAANEVRAIAAEYGPRQSDVYLHEVATETTLKAAAGRHRIIHLATHGIADSRWPMFSALLLAPSAQDDGLLEAREVADMKLDADLVVLSGCDTAGGLIRSGEGVIGLSWAFLLAGCPTTVVSQWSAESKATSQLMIEFHRRLIGGLSAAEALRDAQLSVMRSGRYAHPFYWASFIVLGRP